jgi:Mechanosensitive ion channel, conserved TM helix
MQASGGQLVRFSDQIFAYLPTLAAGLAVTALGVAAGWIAKRVVTRAMIWLRLDRLGGRQGWRAAFGKGDVRAALYDMIGNIVMAAVILLFLDNALQIWGLEVLRQLVDRTITYVPNLALVALIVAAGFLFANIAGNRVTNALEEEGFQRSRFIGKLVKAVLQAVVVSLGVWQIGFAQQIVLAAFLIAFGAIGVAFALAVGIGAARSLQQGLDRIFSKEREKEKDR